MSVARLRWGIAALFALALSLFPLIGEPFYLQLVIKVMIMAIFAMSLDVLVGYTGLVSLGHAAFFGLAGYVVALISPPSEPGNIVLLLLASLAVCAAFALLTGALVLRTSGLYFVMVTLAFAQMLFFVFHDTRLGGGSDGIYINFRPMLAIGDLTLLDLKSERRFYWFVLACVVLVYVLLRRVLASNFGRVLQGIKVNESRLRGLGYSSFRYKLAAYVLSGTVAGLAGSLAALQFGFVNPEILSWHTSGNVLVMVILGGMGTLHGAVVGAAVITVLQEVLSNQAMWGPLAKHWQLLMGLFIIAVALRLPNGLVGLWARRKRP